MSVHSMYSRDVMCHVPEIAGKYLYLTNFRVLLPHESPLLPRSGKSAARQEAIIHCLLVYRFGMYGGMKRGGQEFINNSNERWWVWTIIG